MGMKSEPRLHRPLRVVVGRSEQSMTDRLSGLIDHAQPVV